MKGVAALLLLMVVLMGAGPAVCAKTPKAAQNIILIGWDGAQRDHLKECLAREELPVLKKIASDGTLVAIDVLRRTDTKAGWTQILTGYEPEITGVFSNNRYQPIARGYTIFERLEEHFGPEEFVTAAVIGKKNHLGARGPGMIPVKMKRRPAAQAPERKPAARAGAAKRKAQGKRMRYHKGEPYYLTQDHLDVFINGLSTNEKVGGKALELLEQYQAKPFFFFVHFAEPDHSGHRHGENSQEYTDALISCDEWTGRILAKLEELNLDKQTLVYVTADHGFDEGQKAHSDAPYVFLATNDRKTLRPGTRADITPTLLDRFGVDLDELEPPLSGRSLLRRHRPAKW